MFLQNYLYQAATVLELAHSDPSKLQAPGTTTQRINHRAIQYGNLEFRAMARRFLHFALPCMVSEIWSVGLKNDRPTYEQILKKTSPLALELNKLCYCKRDVVEGTPADIVKENFIEVNLTASQARKVKELVWTDSLKLPFTRTIPFFDDGHGYSFFMDNTPYDASYNLLLGQANQQAQQDKDRAVPIPKVQSVFGYDEYFVIDRFSDKPNFCLGPTNDGSILKKIKLMMGPDYVRDVALTSVKELREMGLWSPTEFEILMFTGKTSTVNKVKQLFGAAVTAPKVLYWSWVEKSSQPDVPMNTKQWIRKELSDRIAPGEVYTLMLDKCTLDWLVENNIARVEELSSGDLFTFPNYDRNRYASRKASERGMSLKEWAWSSEHATKMPQSLGVKIVGLEHPKYIPVEDQSSLSEVETAQIKDAAAVDELFHSALSGVAKELLQWARETEADIDVFMKENETAIAEQSKAEEPQARKDVTATRNTPKGSDVKPAQKSSDGTVAKMNLFDS